jgi:hypothetical protein
MELDADSLATRLRVTHAETMVSELESVALGLFQSRGFTDTTVDEIGSAA